MAVPTPPEQIEPSGPNLQPGGTERLKAFSDGVFAIVITLLVLDLRVPEYHRGELLPSLLREAPSLFAFVVSFVYIGVLWLNHHSLLRMVRGTTFAINWINLGLLLGVVIIPFPTAVLASALAKGNTHDLRVAVVMYALAAALMSLPWLVFFVYLRRRPASRADHVGDEQIRAQRFRPITGVVLYGVTGLLGWIVNPLLGLAGIVVMIIFHGLTSEGIPTKPLRRVPGRRRG